MSGIEDEGYVVTDRRDMIVVMVIRAVATVGTRVRGKISLVPYLEVSCVAVLVVRGVSAARLSKDYRRVAVPAASRYVLIEEAAVFMNKRNFRVAVGCRLYAVR